MVNAWRDPAMGYICTKFDVLAQYFFYSTDTNRHTCRYTKSQMPLIILPTHRPRCKKKGALRGVGCQLETVCLESYYDDN